jgi:uncharacterized membrane protein
MVNFFLALLAPKAARAAGLFEGLSDPSSPPLARSQAIIIIERAIGMLVVAAGFVAFAMFAWSAFLFFTANGEEAKISKAKQVLLFALVGITLILLSRVLVNTFTAVLGGTP